MEVVYGLAGTVNVDLEQEPIGKDGDGNDVFLKDIWYTDEELAEAIKIAANSDYYKEVYADVFNANEQWNALEQKHARDFVAYLRRRDLAARTD